MPFEPITDFQPIQAQSSNNSYNYGDILNTARSYIDSPILNPFAVSMDPIGTFQSTISNPVSKAITSGIANATVLPPIRAAASIPVTAYKDVNAISQAGQSLASIVNQKGWGALSPQNWNTPVNVPYTAESINQQATAPVNLPVGIGNVNYNVGDKNGQFDPYRTTAEGTAQAVDTVEAINNMVNPNMTKPTWNESYLTGFFRGGPQAAAQQVQQDVRNPNLSWSDIGLNALHQGEIGGTISGFMAGLPNMLDSYRNFRAGTAGLEDYQQRTLKNPENTADYYKALDEAKANKGVTGSRTAVDKIGDELKADYKGPFKQEFKSAGQAVGAVVKDATDSGVRVSTEGLKTDFLSNLKDNFQVDMNAEDPFANSKIASDTRGQKEITNLVDWLDNNPDPSPLDLHNKIYDTRQNILKMSTITSGKPIGVAKVPIIDFLDSLDTALKGSLPEGSQAIFDHYSNLAQANQFLGPKLNADKPGSQLLQGLYNENTPEKLVPSLQILSDITGKDYVTVSDIGKTVENVADTGKKLPIPRSWSLRSLLTRFARSTIANPEAAAKGLIEEGAGRGVLGLPQGLPAYANILPSLLKQGIQKGSVNSQDYKDFVSGYQSSHPNANPLEILQAYNYYHNGK